MQNVDFDTMWNMFLIRILPLLVAFGIAAIISLLSRRFVRRALSMNRFVPQHRRLAEQRQQTVQGVLVGLISFGAFTAATFFCIAQFVDLSTLVWVLGLFSAAFGLGFRPLISDYLTGIMFIFEDTLDVGEKVEIVGMHAAEGIVEEVKFRVIHLRGISGELYVIPNGEIRMIRNFSRGKFSPANITLKIAAKDLKKTLNVLETLNQDAMTLLPNMIEPWSVISEEGSIGQNVELTILAKARFGQAAEMRPHLVALLHQHLSAAGIEFAT